MIVRNRMVRSPEGGAGGGDGAGVGAAAAPAVGGGSAGGGGAPDPAAGNTFLASLPEDIRGEAMFQDIKDVGALARSYMHAQRLVGADKATVLALPKGDDPAAWGEVYAKLGRPESPDGYKLTAPEGMQVDAGLQSGFTKTAHELGISAKQAEGLFAWWNGAMQGAAQQQSAATAQQLAAAEASLRQEWGAAFDQQMQAARDAVRHYGGDDLVKELNITGNGNNPELVKLFAKLGGQLREDGVLTGRSGPGGEALTPDAARQQIDTKMKDKEFLAAYRDKAHAKHGEAMAEMTRLYQFAYPSAA